MSVEEIQEQVQGNKFIQGRARRHSKSVQVDASLKSTILLTKSSYKRERRRICLTQDCFRGKSILNNLTRTIKESLLALFFPYVMS